MDLLSAERIRSAVGTSFIGGNVVYFSEIGSTNEEARRLAKEGAPEGTVVVADFQTSGRGRLDRRWEAPRCSSLLISLIFRPDLAPSQTQRLTMICGLAVLDAVRQSTGLGLYLKWPNDIVTGRAKLGGILSEIELKGDQIEYAVVGIGLNVNVDPAQLPRSLLMPATGLSVELGRQVGRLSLLVELLQAIEVRYLALRTGQSPHDEWADHLLTLGKRVSVTTGREGALRGVAEAVDDDGALLVRLPEGRLATVRSGDVR